MRDNGQAIAQLQIQKAAALKMLGRDYTSVLSGPEMVAHVPQPEKMVSEVPITLLRLPRVRLRAGVSLARGCGVLTKCRVYIGGHAYVLAIGGDEGGMCRQRAG